MKRRPCLLLWLLPWWHAAAARAGIARMVYGDGADAGAPQLRSELR